MLNLTMEQALVVVGYAALVAYLVSLIYATLVRSLGKSEFQGLVAVFSGISHFVFLGAYLGSRYTYSGDTVGSYVIWMMPMFILMLIHIRNILVPKQP